MGPVKNCTAFLTGAAVRTGTTTGTEIDSTGARIRRGIGRRDLMVLTGLGCGREHCFYTAFGLDCDLAFKATVGTGLEARSRTGLETIGGVIEDLGKLER